MKKNNISDTPFWLVCVSTIILAIGVTWGLNKVFPNQMKEFPEGSLFNHPSLYSDDLIKSADKCIESAIEYNIALEKLIQSQQRTIRALNRQDSLINNINKSLDNYISKLQ